jgi:hypothetical protein
MSWAAITAVGIAALAVVPRAQGNRLVAFAFFVPIAATMGGAAWWARRGGRRAAAVVLGLVLFGGAMFGWYRQDPHIHPHELRVVARAEAALRAVPVTAPVAVVVDTREVDAALHVIRYLNVIRAGIDPARIPRVRVAVGRPGDVLAGKPTLTGDAEHDRLARESAGTVARARMVLVLQPFTPWFEEARALGREVAPGVIVMGSDGTRPSVTAAAASPGLGPAGLILGCLGALLLLFAAGAGWSAWAFGSVGGRAALALAPSVGAGVLVLAGVVADRAGLSISGGGAAVAALLGLGGYALWGRRARG